jgi:peptide/nickel transport system permease protein
VVTSLNEALSVGAGLEKVSTARRRPVFRLGVWLSVLFVILVALAAIAPSWLASGSPDTINLTQSFLAPSWHHLFGTDPSGRDVYTRVIYGTRQSILIGLLATLIAMVIATILGVTAGLGGKRIDALINRFLEVLFAFPGLLLAFLFVAIFGTGVVTEVVAVAIGSAPGYARMIRGQVLAVKGSGYVEAAYALGHRPRRIIGRQIFPNAMRPLVVLATMGIGQSIVWASSLSFLGLGVAPPSPEWGAMLDAGRDYVLQAWWLEIFPGLAIVLCTLSVTALGRFLQQKLDGGIGV